MLQEDNNLAKLTPAMRQYLEIKEKHAGFVLLYQMGDFYEMFFEDAKVGARVCNLVLTSRNRSSYSPIPMAGIPLHALDNYLVKFVNEGISVAICDQVEKAEEGKASKKVFVREVSRLVTPGTLTAEKHLDAREENLIICYFQLHRAFGLASLELSSGRFSVVEFQQRNQIENEIACLSPAEIICVEGEQPTYSCACRYLPTCDFHYRTCYKRLCDQFQCSQLEGYGCEGMRAGVCAAGALLGFVQHTQRASMPHIQTIKVRDSRAFMEVSAISREALNISPHGKRKRDAKYSSLLEVLDSTCSAMGSRCLRRWFAAPLKSLPRLIERLDAVEWFLTNLSVINDLRAHLATLVDVERVSSRIALSGATPRDIVGLRSTMQLFPSIQKCISSGSCPDILQKICAWLKREDSLYALLCQSIIDAPPPSVKDGGVIRSGYNAALDELRKVNLDSEEYLRTLEKNEREVSGLNLRLVFNKVNGYFFEICKSKVKHIPPHFIRIQTLKNSERFTVDALKTFECQVISAKAKALEREKEIYQEVLGKILDHMGILKCYAEALSQLDVLAAFAKTSKDNNYVRPKLCQKHLINIKGGRHSIVEKCLENDFIPNDIYADGKKRIMMITGPNMGGKSTYMRQIALIVFMAHLGHFVPAQSAEIGIVDRIFTRIGASDDIAQGHSTFMTEMIEAANILHNATPSSLVIMDEIGRGTSTFDGLSLAWACCRHLASQSKAMTLFATHYFELTTLALSYPCIQNFHMAAVENHERVVFLYTLKKGVAEQSFGIQVAKIAGIPQSVLQEAHAKLLTLEEARHELMQNVPSQRRKDGQLGFFLPSVAPDENKKAESFPEPILVELRKRFDAVEPDQMTPLQAMDCLYQIKELLRPKR